MTSWVWKCPHNLRIQGWDDDDLSVVYNASSGDTHLVDLLSVELLLKLQSGPNNTESLLAQLSDRFTEEDRQRMPAFVDATLLKLQDIGLVTSSSV